MGVPFIRAIHTSENRYRGWQRWRRQLLEQNRDTVMVLAQGYDGSCMCNVLLMIRVFPK